MDNIKEEKIHAVPMPFVWFVRILLAALILAAGILGYKKLLSTAKKQQKRPRSERVTTVEVVNLKRVDKPVTVEVTGTVMAARELELKSRVAGYIKTVNSDLEPGAKLAAGTVIATIDKVDFELAVLKVQSALESAKSSLEQAKSSLVDAQYAYKVELGQQEVAKYEWNLVEDKKNATELDKELSLRVPHLKKAVSDVKAAEATVKSAQIAIKDAETSLKLAMLDLERTEVKVPFDCIVLDKDVTVGAEITTQTVLATLVATDELWVEISVPVSRMQWLKIPQNGKDGSSVEVTLTGQTTQGLKWQGEIIRIKPELEENGRMVRAIVSVKNPYDNEIPLLLGAFVNVSVKGHVIKDIFVLPRSVVHEGGIVWLKNAESRLETRNVNVLWGDRDTYVIDKGLNENEKLILTNISTPAPGLKLVLPGEKVEQNKNPKGASGKKGQAAGKGE